MTPDRGAIYFLELTDDLISGEWTNGGYSESGTVAFNANFEWVTNNIPTDVKLRQMIRLGIRDI